MQAKDAGKDRSKNKYGAVASIEYLFFRASVSITLIFGYHNDILLKKKYRMLMFVIINFAFISCFC